MTLNRIRTSARLAATAGLLSAGVLGFAGAATATSGDSVTINNATSLTVTTAHSLDVAATAQPTCQSALGVIAADRTVSITLTGPGSSSQTIATDSQPCDKAASLTVALAAPSQNGSYTVTLQNGTATNTTTAILKVLIPPARVKGLAVTTAGTTATFSWKPDTTRDVTSYQILRSDGTVEQSLRAARACTHKATHCVTSVDLGLGAAGTSQTFTVRAFRCGLSCSKKVPGLKSRPATATFAAATSPTSAPPSTTGTGGSTGGSSGGQSPGEGEGTPPPVASAPPSEPAQPSRSPHPHHSAQSISPSNPITMTPLAPSPTATASQPATTPPNDQASGGNSTDRAPWGWVGAAAVLLVIVAHLAALVTRRTR